MEAQVASFEIHNIPIKSWMVDCFFFFFFGGEWYSENQREQDPELDLYR